jgi:pimeloyl-ACP methyl ester carboxylesterase
MNLNYRRCGAGPPLVIVHGLFGSLVNWQTVGAKLARYWTVFTLDLSNHGDSPHSADFSYDALVEDLKGFMDQYRIGKANLLGHSLGGKIVMAFADRFPGKAEQLIVVDIAPKPYPAGHRHMLKNLIEFDLNRIDSLKEAVAGLATAIPSLAIRQFLVKNLVRGYDGRYRWKVNLDAIYRHYKELSQGPRLRHPYPKPAMFLRGKASEFVIDEDTGQIRRYFPNATIVTMPNAGHWLHIDAPEETVQAVIDFLYRVPSSNPMLHRNEWMEMRDV